MNSELIPRGLPRGASIGLKLQPVGLSIVKSEIFVNNKVAGMPY